MFLWDSVGSIPCRMSVEKSSTIMNGMLEQCLNNLVILSIKRLILSRKENQPYTNTLVAVNKVWVAKPNSPMEQPKMKNKGGDTMFFDSSFSSNIW
jgi:hypothetical protein